MKRIYLLLLLSMGVSAFAQSPVHEWTITGGGSGSEWVHKIFVDNAGNTFASGYFQGTVDFDPGAGIYNLTSNGINDAFILKLDAAGNFVWARSFGGTSQDEGRCATVDNGGNVFLTGVFHGTVDFDPSAGIYNLTSAGYDDCFVIKLNPSGNFLFAKRIGGTSTGDQSFDIITDATGNVYTMGYYDGTVDFDPGPATYSITSAGSSDVFVHKLDAAGNFIWAKSMGGPGQDYGHAIQKDINGNLYCTGIFMGTADFDPGAGVTNLISAGSFDVFIQKLDANGTLVWARSVGGTYGDNGNDICVDNAGNVYANGSFYIQGDFDPGPGVYNLISSASNNDAFLLKLDANGNLVWANIPVESSGTYDYGYSIDIDNGGSLYISGIFTGTGDFDPGAAQFNLTSHSSYDSYIQKLDNGGNFIWATNIGGTSNTYGRSIDVDANGMVRVAGYFGGTTDFDPGAATLNLSSNGADDFFIQKYNQCTPSGSTVNITDCETYTLNGQTYASSGTYFQTLQNVSGCDSTITLNLTIHNNNGSINNYMACDSITINSQTYYASGMYNQTLSNVFGCDSNVILHITIGTATYANINATGCDSVTVNYTTYYTSGIYTQIFNNYYSCDSVLTVNATVHHSENTTINQIACDNYTLNGETYSSTGIYNQTLNTVHGCDSIVTLNLTINSANALVTQNQHILSSSNPGTNYQWIDCDNAMATISGAITQTYTATINGNYALIIEQNGCSDTSDCYLVQNVGIHELNNLHVQLYPNPGLEEFFLDLGEIRESVDIRIADLTGRIVFNQTFLKTQLIPFRVEGVSGIYMVTILIDNNQQTFKLIKQ